MPRPPRLLPETRIPLASPFQGRIQCLPPQPPRDRYRSPELVAVTHTHSVVANLACCLCCPFCLETFPLSFCSLSWDSAPIKHSKLGRMPCPGLLQHLVHTSIIALFTYVTYLLEYKQTSNPGWASLFHENLDSEHSNSCLFLLKTD